MSSPSDFFCTRIGQAGTASRCAHFLFSLMGAHFSWIFSSLESFSRLSQFSCHLLKRPAHHLDISSSSVPPLQLLLHYAILSLSYLFSRSGRIWISDLWGVCGLSLAHYSEDAWRAGAVPGTWCCYCWTQCCPASLAPDKCPLSPW